MRAVWVVAGQGFRFRVGGLEGLRLACLKLLLPSRHSLVELFGTCFNSAETLPTSLAIFLTCSGPRTSSATPAMMASSGVPRPKRPICGATALLD